MNINTDVFCQIIYVLTKILQKESLIVAVTIRKVFVHAELKRKIPFVLHKLRMQNGPLSTIREIGMIVAAPRLVFHMPDHIRLLFTMCVARQFSKKWNSPKPARQILQATVGKYRIAHDIIYKVPAARAHVFIFSKTCQD